MKMNQFDGCRCWLQKKSCYQFGVVVLVALLSVVTLTGAAKDRQVRCVENGQFYRDPERSEHKIWTTHECSQYFLCLDGDVFDFRCSTGRLFDVSRQICDFQANVNNCDITSEVAAAPPKPLLAAADCPDATTTGPQLGCADATCLPSDYFCDGSIDCPDGSDETYCDAGNDPNAAKICDPTTCRLPDCFCSKDGTAIPGQLEAAHVPQMIVLTFDDATTANKQTADNWDLYSKKLFGGDERKNPNGCPIRATFYVSHQFNNNYQQTQKLWNDGHEIAVHSVTHRGPVSWWSHNATIEDWFDEMVGQANILHRFANIRMDAIRGLRVPHLSVGWNRQFLMMKEFGFVYDGSMVVPARTNPPLWPYTLDHRMPHKCIGAEQNCPSRSYAGIWEMVINQLETDDARNGNSCGAMVDSCPLHMSGGDIYQMLVHNFKRHYLTNRAPLGLHFHSHWFKNTAYLRAFERFVDEVLEQPDVWFVTNWQAIQWMRQPTPLHKLDAFDAWQCGKNKVQQFETREIACNLPNVCRLYSQLFQQDRYLYTCTECPVKYPWIRNEFGLLD